MDDPTALAAQPLLVKRLRRLREQRQRSRSASRLAQHG
ncbi:Fis family transcriptional regulator [Mycobacteroides abscessus subsp. abscessus]|nr:Fis family transcriptional regulator [Mycobacteroides abscessus subsp. abscessus]